MVHRAMSFTPQTLLSAPRRSAGVPNALGTKVLYTTSTYSFESHSQSTELRLLDVLTGQAELLAEDEEVSGLNWLDEIGSEFAFLGEGGKELVVGDVRGGKVVAGKFEGPVGDLKVRKIAAGKWAVVVSGEVDSKTEGVFDPERKKKTRSSGKLYKGLFVRHWDRWESAERKTLWYGVLTKERSGKFKLSALRNALKGWKGLETPVRPFGGTDSFDLSTDVDGNGGRIVFVSKDPVANPALNTKCNTYVVELEAWDEEVKGLFEISVPGYEGAATSPAFSPDGKSLVFLKMKTNGYEADRNDIFVLNLGDESTTREATPISAKTAGNDENLARSPSSVVFASDNETLLFTAEDLATSKLFSLKRNGLAWIVWPLTKNGSISDVVPLSTGQIFVSGSSLIDPSFYSLIVPQTTPTTNTDALTTWTSSLSNHGKKFNLSPSQIASIWTPASNPKITKLIHSLVIYPSTFHPSKTYPVAYLIHGGPQSAWNDSWSTRWNPAIFAEQGYIVVAPNPTGSTGYGQAFTDAIRNNWGGDPYQDIVNVVEWVGKEGNLKGADNERAVALGASYGGYMINWIQGHPLGRAFRSLVCHDGITSFPGGMLSTEEFYFPFHDLGGTPWYHPETTTTTPSTNNKTVSNPHPSTSISAWQKYDPSHHFTHWSTPQLVIHSSKDYRLPISEGLAAFNVLQARGVHSQFLTFPDENHWVLKVENSLLWHRVVLNWINRSVGLEAFSEGEEELGEEFFGGVVDDEEEDGEEGKGENRLNDG
ncbi:hypothetical protein M409DRAFT_67949 [Zasmidium cellare ATCC 36951]|uniref:Dipeptidyl-peptidase V n=1 Tax=Zasmidium cellare ATCC 36951 TaxID=1080233 RepID=A0A6A6CEU8_ZASCE|nr:uncharacterized protein M409DRAFT_67949 [Zasmidium cellare ATCC 36951]KAF2164452.1 hypothetical protein M409DRAFT_67949 [Zasmidium cellare ATCC 36951]